MTAHRSYVELQTEGLVVRTLASSAPVVGAAPRDQAGRQRLSPEEEAEMDREMGLAPVKATAPGRDPEHGGRFTLGTMTPSQAREHKAAKRASAGGGK